MLSEKGLLTIKNEAILTHYVLKELGLSVDSIQEFLFAFAGVKCSKAEYMSDFIPLHTSNFNDYIKKLSSVLENNKIPYYSVAVNKSTNLLSKQIKLLTNVCYLIKVNDLTLTLSWDNYKSCLTEIIHQNDVLSEAITFLEYCRVKELLMPLEYLEASLQVLVSQQNQVDIPSIEISEDMFNSVKLGFVSKGDLVSEIILVHKMILSQALCNNLPTVRLEDSYNLFASFNPFNLVSKMVKLVDLPFSKFESIFLSLK